MTFTKGVKYAVFSIKKYKQGSVWTKAGVAFINKDGSMNLYLDVLPLDGTLHVREAEDQPLKKRPDPDEAEQGPDYDEEIPF